MISSNQFLNQLPNITDRPDFDAEYQLETDTSECIEAEDVTRSSR